MMNIETKKVEELKELNNFKNLLLEIKEDGKVVFSIYYYPSFQLIGILSEYKMIHKQRFFTKNNFNKLFIEWIFAIPYYYEALEPEKATFFKESCKIMTEYLQFLEEKKEELFKFCKADIKKEDIKEIKDILKRDFLYTSSGFLIPSKGYIGNYDTLAYSLNEYRHSITFSFDSDSFEIKVMIINKKIYLKVFRNNKIWITLGMDEISNPYKIINHTTVSPLVAVVSYDIFLSYLKNPDLYDLYNHLCVLLNTNELQFNMYNNTFILSNWNRKCSIYIKQYSINEELLYKIQVYTGMYAEEYSEETVYTDTMKKDSAVRYLLDIIECRTDNKIEENKIILEELFDCIKNNLQVPPLLEEETPSIDLAMMYYSKYEYSEEGDKIFYSKYNFYNNDIEKITYEIFRENEFDFLRREETDNIYSNSYSEMIIKADNKSNDIIQLIHREVAKRINRTLEKIKGE